MDRGREHGEPVPLASDRRVVPRLAGGGARASCPAHATETVANTRETLAIGVIAHDRGPASDHHENGVDLNLEVQFAPLAVRFPVREMPLRPHLGATLNLTGDTSVAYTGLSARFHEQAKWFGDLLLSVAVHDGPLHKDPAGCTLYSDCGFGVRVMPRFGLEIGSGSAATQPCPCLATICRTNGSSGARTRGSIMSGCVICDLTR